jgi:hypothetical protein
MLRVTKDKIKRNIMKKTQYMTNLPTFSQIKSTNLTYEDINFGITVTIIKIDKKSIKKGYKIKLNYLFLITLYSKF